MLLQVISYKFLDMMRKILSPILSIFLFATSMSAAESIVKVSQAVSQQKAYSGGNFIVKIKIERRNLDSYFQIEQILPKGMTAEGMESQGATFSNKDGKVKFSWLRLPANEEILVIYKVKVPFEMRGKQTIEGSYYYIQNEEKEVFSLAKTSIDIIEYVAPSDSLAEKALLGVINNDEFKPAYMSEEKDNLEYKVQILSSTKPLDKDSLRKEYAVKDKVNEENFNGLYKYTVGSFKTYENARDYKNKLDFQKYIPFVIAYNRGARITVGEAMQLASKKKTVVKD
jgi:hypothetical protein